VWSHISTRDKDTNRLLLWGWCALGLLVLSAFVSFSSQTLEFTSYREKQRKDAEQRAREAEASALQRREELERYRTTLDRIQMQSRQVQGEFETTKRELIRQTSPLQNVKLAASLTVPLEGVSELDEFFKLARTKGEEIEENGIFPAGVTDRRNYLIAGSLHRAIRLDLDKWEWKPLKTGAKPKKSDAQLVERSLRRSPAESGRLWARRSQLTRLFAI
jgi:hypothetical protein